MPETPHYRLLDDLRELIDETVILTSHLLDLDELAAESVEYEVLTLIQKKINEHLAFAQDAVTAPPKKLDDFDDHMTLNEHMTFVHDDNYRADCMLCVARASTLRGADGPEYRDE